MKLKIMLLAITVLSFNLSAAIIDNDDILTSSFKDTETGIVWMDFGVNNNQSFNYVQSQLGEGGLYNGWRLPNVEEVYTMWNNIMDLDNVDAGYESYNRFGTGQHYAGDLNSPLSDDSVWDSVFDVIGFNSLGSSTNAINTFSQAYFLGTNGLSLVEFRDYSGGDGNRWDTIYLRDDINFTRFGNDTKSYLSTLLISDVEVVAQVPEPTTVAMMVLGLLGIGFKRRS